MALGITIGITIPLMGQWSKFYYYSVFRLIGNFLLFPIRRNRKNPIRAGFIKKLSYHSHKKKRRRFSPAYFRVNKGDYFPIIFYHELERQIGN